MPWNFRWNFVLPLSSGNEARKCPEIFTTDFTPVFTRPFAAAIAQFRGFAKGWFPKGWYWRMFLSTKNRNKGTFAKSALLRNHPFVSSRQIHGVWSAANRGFRDGVVSKSEDIWGKGLFPPFSGFCRCSPDPLERGEKGRKRATKAAFGRFPRRAAWHTLNPPICYTPICGSPIKAGKRWARNLRLRNAVIPRKSENLQKWRKSAKNCEFGPVCPFEFVPFNSPWLSSLLDNFMAFFTLQTFVLDMWVGYADTVTCFSVKTWLTATAGALGATSRRVCCCRTRWKTTDKECHRCNTIPDVFIGIVLYICCKSVPRIFDAFLTQFWRISDAFWNVPLFPIKQDAFLTHFWRISDAFVLLPTPFPKTPFGRYRI